jgi:hypothetical protein
MDNCKNFLAMLPDPGTLAKMYPKQTILDVNAHIHTPYSFSAFESIKEIFTMAKAEHISVAGINDFFVTEGYEDFCTEALQYKIFPLFNIEFMGLLKEEQRLNIRINDPNNPGRCYFSGKGLDYPFHLQPAYLRILEAVIEESQKQVKTMILKTNDWFSGIDLPLRLDYEDIRIKCARNLVRERHIAKAIRIAVYEHSNDEQERIGLLQKIFGGEKPGSSITDISGIENEIRSNLLKAGGMAFVTEDESAFMTLDDIIRLISDAGGIPCYPVLLDDKNGDFTEYEKDPDGLYSELAKHNIGCIEFIPGRNHADYLREYVRYFHDKGFVILLGTEHNAPGMIPLTCYTRGKVPLDDYLREISYEGACVVAAHQYLRANKKTGFIDNKGLPIFDKKGKLAKLGNAVIHHTISKLKNQTK